MKLHLVFAIAFVLIGFQNCSPQNSPESWLQPIGIGAGNGDGHQGLGPVAGPEDESQNEDPSYGGASDTSVEYFALPDETNSCGGASAKSVKVQASVRITPQGLSWERLSCKPARGMVLDGTQYFKSRTFKVAVIDKVLFQTAKVTATSISRSGLYDVYCTNAPGNAAPPAGKPRVELLVQKLAPLDAELPGAKFLTGGVKLRRKVTVNVQKDYFTPTVSTAYTSIEDRPKGNLVITSGEQSGKGNWLLLKAADAEFKKSHGATLSGRAGSLNMKAMGVRCYRNRHKP